MVESRKKETKVLFWSLSGERITELRSLAIAELPKNFLYNSSYSLSLSLSHTHTLTHTQTHTQTHTLTHTQTHTHTHTHIYTHTSFVPLIGRNNGLDSI